MIWQCLLDHQVLITVCQGSATYFLSRGPWWGLIELARFLDFVLLCSVREFSAWRSSLLGQVLPATARFICGWFSLQWWQYLGQSVWFLLVWPSNDWDSTDHNCVVISCCIPLCGSLTDPHDSASLAIFFYFCFVLVLIPQKTILLWHIKDYYVLSVNLGSLLDLGRHPPSLDLFLGPMWPVGHGRPVYCTNREDYTYTQQVIQ